MSAKIDIIPWEYTGIKTCIDRKFTTHYDSRGVTIDCLVEYSCQKCGWKPTNNEMNKICFARDYQPLIFHAAMCKMIRHYNGWSVYHNPNGPVTGQYIALRYGIRIGANTESMLISMIDAKCDLYTPGGCHKDCCKDRYNGCRQ